MNRRRLDVLVGALVAGIVLVGGGLTWEAYRQQRAFSAMGDMMGESMSAMHGVNPVWYATGTLVLAGFVLALYASLRQDLTAPAKTVTSAGPAATEQVSARGPTGDDATGDQSDGAQAEGVETADSQPAGVQAKSSPPVLDVLPEDERRILEPVLESPGLTQIALRDRAGFSKSKVSQTVSDLEKRGLLYRERQGRTYRVYPSEDLT